MYDNWGGENNGWANQENIIQFAQQVGLNMDDFIDCNANRKFEEKISASNADANTLGITGTPAFYIISTTNGQVQHIQGAQPYEVFEKIFNIMLEN